MFAGDDGGVREEVLFDAALADPHTMVWVLGPDGSVRRAGDAALSTVDASAGDVEGVPFAATPWWDEAAVESYVERALDGEPVRFRAAAAGTPVDVVLRPVGTDGEVRAVVAAGREVTPAADRRAKLAALHDVATRLEGADDEAAVHELTVEAATDVLSLSPCFVGAYEGASVAPAAWSAALDRESAAAMGPDDRLAERALGDGRSVVVDDAGPDGEYAAWLAVPLGDATLLVAADRQPGAFDGVDRELADVLAAHAGAALRRVRHQRRLRRQNERLEEFASVVAHDLRNPLGAMRANLQVARELDDPEVLDAIERSVDRMDELLEDLLQLASVGEAAAESEQVRLADAAEGAWETAAPADATLSVDGDVALEADPSRLKQLLENLFDNAVEHGGADVAVRLGPIDGTGFYVADDGPGIPAEDRETVFEHGFTTADDGTGFGLSIVRRIAETHGWTASVGESAAGGARFEFTGVDAGEPAE